MRTLFKILMLLTFGPFAMMVGEKKEEPLKAPSIEEQMARAMFLDEQKRLNGTLPPRPSTSVDLKDILPPPPDAMSDEQIARARWFDEQRRLRATQHNGNPNA
ncbi:MAG: hypothetical protein ACLQVD_21470 [Capsulimonadaceae bacterium]